MNEPTTLTIQDRGDNLKVIQFHGDLDSVGVRMVEDAFAKATGERAERAVVDLSHVAFISSAGLAMILVKGKALRRGGGVLTLAGANRRILEVLSMAGFHELFDICPSPDEA